MSELSRAETNFSSSSTRRLPPNSLITPHAADSTKEHQNRLHLDFRPDDQPAEVQRLLELGATRVDVGQGDVPWVVLADPEGNEFCVLGARSGDA